MRQMPINHQSFIKGIHGPLRNALAAAGLDATAVAAEIQALIYKKKKP